MRKLVFTFRELHIIFITNWPHPYSVHFLFTLVYKRNDLNLFAIEDHLIEEIGHKFSLDINGVFIVLAGKIIGFFGSSLKEKLARIFQVA